MDKSWLIKAFLAAFFSATLVLGARAQSNEVAPDNGICASGSCVIANPNSSSAFEINASLLFLKPASGNLLYSTLISPLPPLTPHWSDQAVNPDFSPGFNIGIRYMFSDTSGDIRIDWTHLNTYDSASAVAASSQALGPSFLIGPPPPYSSASAVAHFDYDAINVDVGLFTSPFNHVQLRTFAGLQVGRISQRLSTGFQSSDGSIHFTDSSKSLFTGVGPRLGTDLHYLAGNFDLVGGIAGSLLIGTMQSRTDFITTSPIDTSEGLTPNRQYLTSPDSTRVIPCIDAKLGASYTIPVGKSGILKCEAGYQAAVYFDAINQYSLTEVENPASVPFEGNASVFLRSSVESQSNFMVHGPYVKFSFQF